MALRRKSLHVEKQEDSSPNSTKTRRVKAQNIRFCGKLSRSFFKQLPAGSVLLNLGMQFVYVSGHCRQKHLCCDLLLPAKKELPKTVILLHRTKNTFGLDRAIHAKQYTLFAGDSFQGFRPLLNETPGNVALTVALRTGTGFLEWTTGTVVTFIVGDFAFKPAFALAVTYILDPELLPCLTDIFILLRIIDHVFLQGHIAFILLRLAALIILRLDVTVFCSPSNQL